MSTTQNKRVWILSELYFPEQSATGHYMTGLAEQLVGEFDVFVLCSQPTYSRRGTAAPQREYRNGVNIIRCPSTKFNKDRLFGRVCNALTITIVLLFEGLLRIGRGDVVLVVTNPPTLPFVALLACWLKHGKCIMLSHDVYPDVLVHASIVQQDSWLVRAAMRFSRVLLKHLDAVVTLGRDMQQLIQSRVGDAAVPVVVLTNWADSEFIDCERRPQKQVKLLADLGLSRKFVVQYSGNLGRTHDVTCLLDAAAALNRNTNIHFLIIGSGAQKRAVQAAVDERELSNVSVLDPVERSKLADSLNSCDVAVVSLKRGMFGVSVPSRTYNILAIGKPILAIVDEGSEVARVVHEEQAGWVVAPGDVAGVVKVLNWAYHNPESLALMSQHAQIAATEKYTLRRVAEGYKSLISEVLQNEL